MRPGPLHHLFKCWQVFWVLLGNDRPHDFKRFVVMGMEVVGLVAFNVVATLWRQDNVVVNQQTFHLFPTKDTIQTLTVVHAQVAAIVN